MVSSGFKKMWNEAYIKLIIFEYCLQIGMQMVQPITANAAISMGATVAFAGLIAGTFSVVVLVLRFVSGPFFARIPLKKLIVFSAVALAVSSLPCWFLPNIAMLGATRIIYGIGTIIKTVVGVAVCVRVVPKEYIGQSVAWLGMANVFAVAVGPTISQAIATNLGYPYVFLISGIAFIIGFVVSLFFPDLPAEGADTAETEDGEGTAELAAKAAEAIEIVEDAKTEGATIAAIEVEAAEAEDTIVAAVESEPAEEPKHQNPILRFLNEFFYIPAFPIAVLGLFEGTLFGIMNLLTLTAGELRGLPETSYFFTVYVLVAFTMRPVFGKLYDKYGFVKVCLPLTIMLAASMFTFAYTDSLLMIIVDGVLFAFGQGCLWPCLQAEGVKDVPTDKTSLAVNTLLLGVDVGMTVGPIAGGVILDIAGPTVMYLCGGVIGILLVLWVFPYARIMKKRAAAREAERVSESE